MDFYGTMLVKKSNNEDISLLGANDLAFKKCLENTLMNVTADMLDGVSNIRNYAFYKCSYLENIEIPSSVISIGNSAFYECTGLKSVTIHATTPPNLEYNVFSNTPNTLKIYVPAASVDAYKAARNWSTYASQIEAIPNN